MTGGDRPSDGPVMYTRGRAGIPIPAHGSGRGQPTEAAGPPDIGGHGWWTTMVEERLTGIEDNTFDLADQVRMLGHRVTVALLTAIAAIAALVAVAILDR